MRPEGVIKFTDVLRQILQGGLSEYGAVVAEVGGLAAVKVNLGVIGSGPAGQLGAQLSQLPVRTVDKLGAIVGLEPHCGIRAGVRANGPRLVVDPSLVVILDPLGHVIKLVPWVVGFNISTPKLVQQWGEGGAQKSGMLRPT